MLDFIVYWTYNLFAIIDKKIYITAIDLMVFHGLYRIKTICQHYGTYVHIHSFSIAINVVQSFEGGGVDLMLPYSMTLFIDL